MSEFNFEKFSYQRKPSVFNQDDSGDKRSCASTSASRNYSSHLDLDPRDETKCQHALKEKDVPLSNGDWSAQLADIMEIFPSETRLQLVDVLTSSSSIDQAMNSACDDLVSNSGK